MKTIKEIAEQFNKEVGKVEMYEIQDNGGYYCSVVGYYKESYFDVSFTKINKCVAEISPTTDDVMTFVKIIKNIEPEIAITYTQIANKIITD